MASKHSTTQLYLQPSLQVTFTFICLLVGVRPACVSVQYLCANQRVSDPPGLELQKGEAIQPGCQKWNPDLLAEQQVVSTTGPSLHTHHPHPCSPHFMSYFEAESPKLSKLALSSLCGPDRL